MTATDAIREMHRVYCQETGFNLPCDMGREAAWFELHRRGVTVADLRLVIRHVQAGIRAQRRNQGAPLFRTLVCNRDYFEEDLAEAKARARVPVPDAGRAQVLRATGRPERAEPAPARKAGEVLNPKGVPISDAIAAMRAAVNKESR